MEPEWAMGRILPFGETGNYHRIHYRILGIGHLGIGDFSPHPRAARGVPSGPWGRILGLGLLLGFFGFIALYLAVKRTSGMETLRPGLA